MLVITRRPNKKVMIGDDIVVWPTMNSLLKAVVNVDAPTGTVVEQVGDNIVIGDDITIKVLNIGTIGGKKSIRLGFDAPKEVPIWREEIYKKMQAERAEA